MNNSLLTVEEDKPIDRIPWLREREQVVIKIIEALNRVNESQDWGILRDEIFDGTVENLEKRMKSETDKSELNQSEIHRLQGQLIWARKYADLGSLVEFFKLELVGIRKQTHG